jgi:hypothetical protein
MQKKRADTRMFLPYVTVAIIEMRPSFVMLNGVERKNVLEGQTRIKRLYN